MIVVPRKEADSKLLKLECTENLGVFNKSMIKKSICYLLFAGRLWRYYYDLLFFFDLSLESYTERSTIIIIAVILPASIIVPSF